MAYVDKMRPQYTTQDPFRIEKPRPPHFQFVIIGGILEQTSLVGLFIIFTIFIILLNIFFIVVTFLSKPMRSSSRHFLIINVCVCDLIMGLFVLPVILNIGLQSDEGRSSACHVIQPLRIFADFLIPSVSTLAVLAVNIDYILRLCCNAYAEGIKRIVITAILFLFPWLFSTLLLIPLYKENIITPYLSRECSFLVDDTTSRTLLLVSFFPQALLLLISMLAVAGLYLFNRDSFGLDIRGDRVRAPIDICLSSFAILVLYAPVFLISFITTKNPGCESQHECGALHDLYVFAIWIFLSKSWLVCLLWLTCADTRSYILQLLGF